MVEGYGLVQIRSGDTLYDLGTVTSITDTLNKAITSIPIVSLSTDSTFALESNTSNKFTVSFSRKNPLHMVDGELRTYESDSDYFSTSWKWTNSLWSTAICSLLNRWQVRTDGYTLFINVSDASRVLTDESDPEYHVVTSLFPSYQGINVYISSLSINLEEGQTELLTGEMEFVVGGRLTEKLSVAADDLIKFKLSDQDEFDADFKDYITATNSQYVPLADNEGHRLYNAHNEYTEGITASRAFIYISVADLRDGVISAQEELPLMIGKSYDLNTRVDYDWEYDYYNDLDLVSSYTLTGGVESPFEKLVLKISKRAFTRTYPDIALSLTTGNEVNEETGIRARVIPGVSKIKLSAVGRGEYIVTECALSGNEYTLTAYSEIERVKGLIFADTEQIWKSPFSMIRDILTNSSWGLELPYNAWQIISNVEDIDWRACAIPMVADYGISSQTVNSITPANLAELLDEFEYSRAIEGQFVDATLSKLITEGASETFPISVIGNTPMWEVMQACAYMLNAKIFFANNRVYVIDYTILDKSVEEPANSRYRPSTELTEMHANRLIIRAGLDRAQYPSPWWGIQYDVDGVQKYLTTDGEEIGDPQQGWRPMNWNEIQDLEDSKLLIGQINDADSVELHSDNSYDRLCGRVYGTVTQDSQGLTTVYNTASVKYSVYVKYREPDGTGYKVVGKKMTRTLWFGAIRNADGRLEVGEWISDLNEGKSYSLTHNNEEKYRDVRTVAERSIRNSGEHKYELDLTPYFTYLPETYARQALYTILKYRAEPQESIKFTVNERCTGAIKESKSGGWGESYWSALFPNVCAAKQFTDVEQGLAVSGIGFNNSSRYYPQKLALSKYSREYPSGRTTYWFGVTNSLDLASSTSSIVTQLNNG